MKNDRILIQDAAFVVTMDSQRRIIRDGSILLEGQRISAVGKSDEISKINVDRVNTEFSDLKLEQTKIYKETCMKLNRTK